MKRIAAAIEEAVVTTILVGYLFIYITEGAVRRRLR